MPENGSINEQPEQQEHTGTTGTLEPAPQLHFRKLHMNTDRNH